jgi:hypothetical protein
MSARGFERFCLAADLAALVGIVDRDALAA